MASRKPNRHHCRLRLSVRPHVGASPGDQDRRPVRAFGRRGHGRHQFQERRRDGRQGDQCRGWHSGQEDRAQRLRHANQPWGGQGPGHQGHRRQRLRRVRPGVLGLDHGQHGRDPARRSAQLHRRRSAAITKQGNPYIRSSRYTWVLGSPARKTMRLIATHSTRASASKSSWSRGTTRANTDQRRGSPEGRRSRHSLKIRTPQRRQISLSRRG